MPTLITGIRRRKPFVGSPLRAAIVVSVRPPVRPLVVSPARRAPIGRGTVGRPSKSVAQIVAKRSPAVLVAALRRPVRFAGSAIVGRPAKAVAVQPAKRAPSVLTARARRVLPFFGRAILLRVPPAVDVETPTGGAAVTASATVRPRVTAYVTVRPRVSATATVRPQ